MSNPTLFTEKFQSLPLAFNAGHILHFLNIADEADDLPDGSCFRRTIHGPNVRRNLNINTAAIRNAEVSRSMILMSAYYVRQKLCCVNNQSSFCFSLCEGAVGNRFWVIGAKSNARECNRIPREIRRPSKYFYPLKQVI